MDLIWLSHFLPYPPRGGAAQRSYNLLRQAAIHHRVCLVAFHRPEQPPEVLTATRLELERFCHRVEILELPARWRGPLWWARLLQSPFVSAPAAVNAYWSDEIGEKWLKVLGEYPDALVHIDSSDLASFVPSVKRLPSVLNHHNCESAMLRRRADLEGNPLKKWFLRSEARKQLDLESRLLSQVHVNLTVSEEERDCLRQINKAAIFRIVENGTDTDFFHPMDLAPEENTVVFAGSLCWYPNQSGLRFFIREVWPALKQRRPGLRGVVAGQAPPEALRRLLTSAPDILLVSDPEDIRPWIARGAVYVCPILDGGGSRLKLLDAMAMGKAIVSTEVGAEGLRVTSGVHMIVVDAPGQFAYQVLSLLDNASLRGRLEAQARYRAVSEYSWPVIGERLRSAYEAARIAAAGSPQ